ncbi:non-ribosomal peptide synthetase [Amycolatopsis cihanbeyliensis]|uniref:Amino acid adenylation domain-containing protein/thioester reductase-like protein n=1 Tax=Amycolatopsis cihanbeyliensis TaxID=1128664 RepID=A0A542DFD5_AMYCI|nr:non-ribosomal peptide synthetase [Amycolatopsis cihanbeyliensis]TQJ01808.1 amino acid adenylation domain-containing protein/thioester reductase-like protein [Amycolatopsis cihanbeyliensis]
MTTESTAAREALLARLLAKDGFHLSGESTVPRRAQGAEVPLSSAQHRLWFLDNLAGGDTGTAAYLMPAAYRLTGELDVTALTGALDAMVRRHEALRAAILPTESGEPVHVIAEPAAASPVRLAHYDISALSTKDAEERARELAEQDTGRPMRLDRPPLLRATLIRRGDEEHVLVLCAHHIVCDDLSLGILTHDLMAAYQSIVDGDVPETGEPAVRFGDYLVWRRERGGGDLGYWVEHLSGAPPLLELPTDRRRPEVRRFRGDSVTVDIPAELSAAVHELARRAEATPFMVLLAAFSVLLGRYSGGTDLVVGSPVANRNLPELDDLVGMFVNTLALRMDLSGDPTLEEVLARARQVAVSGLSHADVPLEDVIERINPTRDLGYNPLFQVMLVVNPDPPRREERGPRVQPVGLGATPARFDLTLVVTDAPEGLRGHLDFDADLFDPATVSGMATGLVRVLRAMVREPGLPARSVGLVEPAELERVAAGPPAAATVPVTELITARAAESPGAPAVLGQDEEISYAELLHRANRVARRLLAAGAGPEVPIGLCAPAGVDAIVGLLGILLSGSAYVPLDPGHPVSRLSFLLADTGAPAVVTRSARDGRFADFPGTVVALDEPGGEGGPAPPAPEIRPEQLAYVIYTSGSTGEPKGVMVRHGALANLATAFRDAHGIGAGTRLLMVPPLTFDASAGDIFPALISGAALMPVAEPAALSAGALREVCAEHGITAVDTAAAIWRQWVHDLAGAGRIDPGPLRVLMVGGEQIPADTLRTWAEVTGGAVPLYNHYGPTEATVCALTYRTVDGTELGDTSVPCGRPLPGVRAYVLDHALRPLPAGVPGELYLAGSGLARGYLGDPARTAAAFPADPFSPAPGGRMYRTGDLAKVRADGNLEFLGRADRQVKIRGNRIELGEVEAAIKRLPGVRDTAVVAHGDPARLVAYLVPEGEAEPARLRETLARVLPDHLVPSGFVPIEALPLTRNGKVDRTALPAPREDVLARPAHVPPASGTERALADIWARTLDVTTVGAGDNFFDLGGHSLQAAGVLAEVRSALGVRLPVRTLFEAPDLAAFAAAVRRVRSGAVEPTRQAAGIDLRGEAVLPDDVCADLSTLDRFTAEPAAPEEVLITGATGMLGARLLLDVLRNTSARAHCLVRAPSADEATARLHEVLRRCPDWKLGYADRIIALPGEVSRPRLGLPAAEYDRLCEVIDTVYHSASLVNVVLPYPRLRADNVTGTVEVLRLAGRRRPKATHAISTLGVFFGSAYAGEVVTEADPPADPDGMSSAYAQSKWVSDTLARAARERGLPVSLHRPARVTGDSRTGESKTDDVLARMLGTVVRLGCAPSSSTPFDMAPTDFLASAIGRLSRAPQHGGREFHYYNPNTTTGDRLGAGLRDFGYPVSGVTREEWTRRTGAALDAGDELPIGVFTGYDMPDRLPVFDCAATERELAAAGLAYPTVDAGLLRTYLRYLVERGVLPRPAGR